MPTLELNTILNTRTQIQTPIDEMRAIEHITAGVIPGLARLLGLSKKELVAVLPVSAKTVERLKKGIIENQVLAEHILHLAKVAQEGTEVFEAPPTLARWLKNPHPAINGLEPYEILRTVTGCRIIVDLLGRAKHGIAG